MDLYPNFGTDPASQMSYRLLDMKKNLFKCVEIALRVGKSIVMTGDIFESKVKIPAVCLQVFGDYLKYAAEKGISVFICQGNHDAESHQISALSAFDSDNCVVVSSPKVLKIENKRVGFVPYTHSLEDTRIAIRAILDREPDFLVGHFGMGDVELQRGFCEKDKVFSEELQSSKTEVILGHYHCFSQVSDNVRYLGTPVAQTFTEADMPHFIAVNEQRLGTNFLELIEVDWVKQLSVAVIDSEADLRRLDSSKFYYKIQVTGDVDLPKNIGHVVRVDLKKSTHTSAHIEDALSGFKSKEDLIADYVEQLPFTKKKTLFETALDIVRGGA